MNVSSIMAVGTVVLSVLLAAGCKKPSAAAPAVATNTAPVVTHVSVKTTYVAEVSAAVTNAAPVGTNAPSAPLSNAPVAPLNSRSKDLGTVQLTNRYETQVQVGDGKSCIIKPILLDPQRLQLTMTLESRLADGKTHGLKVMSVVTKPDQPLEVDFGNLVVTLTPQLVTPPPQ